MKTSESILKISPALLKAQKSIKFAVKDSVNPHFRSKYADLSSVIEAIKEPLNDNGITFIQGYEESDTSLKLTTRLQHESGEFIESTNTIPLVKMDAQGYGSTATYARRYALAAITGLYQDDDDGNAGSAKPASDKEKKQAKYLADQITTAHNDQNFELALNTYVEQDNDMRLMVWEHLRSDIRSHLKELASRGQ